MDFRTATSRKLDEEHRDSLALLGRFERGVLGVAVGSAPDDGFALLAKQVARAVAGEVDRHFRFEEEQLFPRLAAGGEGDLADLLLDEHKSIRAAAADLLPPLLAAWALTELPLDTLAAAASSENPASGWTLAAAGFTLATERPPKQAWIRRP